jgi:hypothetical protein
LIPICRTDSIAQNSLDTKIADSIAQNSLDTKIVLLVNHMDHLPPSQEETVHGLQKVVVTKLSGWKQASRDSW